MSFARLVAVVRALVPSNPRPSECVVLPADLARPPRRAAAPEAPDRHPVALRLGRPERDDA